MKRLKGHIGRVVNGRRGAFQALFAFAYLALGLSYVAMPSGPARAEALSWLTDQVPLNVLGFLWVAAAAFAFCGSSRPRPKDKWSFVALTLAPTLWGFFYLISTFVGTFPQGWVTSILYWCIAAGVMVVSGMTGDNDRDEREVRAVRR